MIPCNVFVPTLGVRIALSTPNSTHRESFDICMEFYQHCLRFTATTSLADQLYTCNWVNEAAENKIKCKVGT